MSAELLAVVEVDKDDRVVCQAQGCGHSVYRRIHVVRQDGVLGVYGSDCFSRLFAGTLPGGSPRYGSGDGRELTPAERLMLVENTERLIAQFETEHQEAIEQMRLRQEQTQKLAQAERERTERARLEAERRRPPSPSEMASVEAEAKQMVRAKYGVDPDAPGWRGLVMKFQHELLGR